MPKVTVDLPDNTYNRLKETAEFHEMSIEQAARRAVETWNDRPHSDEEFEETIDDWKSFDGPVDTDPPFGDEDETE